MDTSSSFSTTQASQEELEQLPIFLFGMGRLGTSLIQALNSHQWPIIGTWNRSHQTESDSFSTSGTEWPVAHIQKAKILLLTVADHAIPIVIQRLKPIVQPGQMILHCSGRLSSQILSSLQEKGCSIGSFHPLQPITCHPGNRLLFQHISVGAEGDADAIIWIHKIIELLGGHSFSLQEVERPLYHAAAVFASNYLVTLTNISCELLTQSGVSEAPLPLLLPLIKAAIKNIEQHGISNALTGPIARADEQAIQAHIQSIFQHLPKALPLYTHLAQETLPIAQKQKKQKSLPNESMAQISKLLAQTMQKDEADTHLGPKHPEKGKIHDPT